MGTKHVEGAPMVVGREHRVVEHCLVACAAAGVEPRVVREPDEVRRGWAEAAVVLVQVEMAAMVAGLGLAARQGVHVVGLSADELVGWSAPLGAAVLVLPEQSGLLTSLVDRRAQGPGAGHLVGVSGGSGGVGASTLACALAQAGHARGLRSAVVEMAPFGGGLDLLFGAEAAPGWRWAELASATGHVGDLGGQLVNVSGVDVVANARPGRGSGARPGVGAEAARAVVSSLTRSHDLVVLDLGRGAPLAADAFDSLTHLLLCPAEVRATMATRALAEAEGWRAPQLVVRRGRGWRLGAEQVAESLGIELVGVLGDDPRVPRAAELGDPPGRGRGRYSRQVRRLLDEVLS